MRLLSFYVLVNLGSIPLIVLGTVLEDTPSPERLTMTLVMGLAWYPLTALGIGLLVCTMRARNGYRGLHEFLSGTRVVQLAGAREATLCAPNSSARR